MLRLEGGSRLLWRFGVTGAIWLLWRFSVTGTIWNWFQNYLTNIDMQQFIEIDGAASTLLPVASGVPQGSMLGLLYIPFLRNCTIPPFRQPLYCFHLDLCVTLVQYILYIYIYIYM